MDKENKELFIDIGRKRIMLEKYRKNIELLKLAVETDAVIRPIAKHRKPDGSLDIEGNLQDAGVQNALRGLKEEALNFRILGNY